MVGYTHQEPTNRWFPKLFSSGSNLTVVGTGYLAYPANHHAPSVASRETHPKMSNPSPRH
jgi:hypothetical protein